MSVRYKIALLSLGSLIVIGGYYFARVLAGVAPREAMPLLIGVIVALALIQVAGQAIITGTSSDRYGPKDERERAIDQRATTVGYHLLVVGALAAIATIHFGAGRSDMGNAMLLAIVVAECGRQGLFLALHHRAA